MRLFVDHHPFQFLVLTALALLFLWNLRGYWTGQIRVAHLHHRPQEYLPLAALAAELLHLDKGC